MGPIATITITTTTITTTFFGGKHSGHGQSEKTGDQLELHAGLKKYSCPSRGKAPSPAQTPVAKPNSKQKQAGRHAALMNWSGPAGSGFSGPGVLVLSRILGSGLDHETGDHVQQSKDSQGHVAVVLAEKHIQDLR